MKTKIFLLTLISFLVFNIDATKAQPTTATDFTIIDCNGGGPHNLFSDLNAGKAVIIEYFMINCAACIDAGDALEVMKANLLAKYPGMIKAYAFAFNNSYTCTQVNNWVNTNGYNSIPSDSGAYQVAYYGGMGMPTVVILGGGINHSVLGTPYVGFLPSDTASASAAISNFLNATGINEVNSDLNKVNVFPVPANNKLNIEIDLVENSNVKVELMDVTGRLISELVNENFTKGKTAQTVETHQFSEGTYILKITTNTKVETKKINIVH